MAVVDAAIFPGPDAPAPRRWSADEFIRLTELGLLREDRHYELLDGEIWLNLGNYEGLVASERHRWSADEYARLEEMGLLSQEGEHYELLDGEIWSKLGQDYPHISGIDLATEALRRVFGSECLIRQQSSLRLADSVTPEPDVLVLRGAPRDFENRAPRLDEIALVVEVVDSRPDTALGPKVALYARHGIAEYWVLNVRDRTLQVRRGPLREFGDWAEMRIYGEAESVAPLGAPGDGIAIAELLPTIAPESAPTP